MLDDGTIARVDALFTDVVLPGGMSGPELAAAVRRRWPEAPALYTSGYTPAAVAGHPGLAGDARLLAKPYRIDNLAVAIRHVIDTRGK